MAKGSYAGFLKAARQIDARKKGKVTEDDPRWNPRTMGNHRGSKNTKTARMNGQYRPT